MSRPLSRLWPLVSSFRSNSQCSRFLTSFSKTLIQNPPRRDPLPPLRRPSPFTRGYAKIVPSPERRGIPQMEYNLRRNKLMDTLPDDSVCVIIGASMKFSSDSVFYPFHQDPNFFYLTGLVEKDALAVLRKDPSTPKGYAYHLFVLPTIPDQVKWVGETIGPDGAITHYNADEGLPNTNIASDLPALLTDAKRIYVSFPTISGSIADEIRPRPRFLSHVSRLLPFLNLDDRYTPLAPYVHSLRAVKSPAEIACMRSAGRISGNAFNEVIRRNLTTEKDVEATLEFLFRMGGCHKAAYVPVVAGGKNALTIHYTRNEMDLREGEMVLVDAGGLYEGYVADITRTWPVSRKFTEPQRDLYQAVLNVQKECIKMCVEDGQRTIDDILRASVELISQELRNLGFQLNYRDLEGTLYPHHISHHVGLEVHDCSTLPRGQALKAGNCITIEPGVYVPDDEKWPKHFRGIGIRIEDCVVVGEAAGRQIVLSADAVKEIVDIEALRE